MKKLVSALLVIVFMLTAFAYAEEFKPAMTVAGEFEFTLQPDEMVFVEHTVFTQDVVVNGDYGMIVFSDCVFLGNIVNNAANYTRVVLTDGCRMVEGAKCIVNSGVQEGSMEYEIPKFVSDSPIEVESDGISASCALGGFDIVFNGETYTPADIQVFVGAEGVVPYEGQDFEDWIVAQWWENGEKVIFICAE